MCSETTEPNASVNSIVHRPYRFGSLLGGVIVAYPKESRRMAVVVRMDNGDEQWDCYCNDVEFQSFTEDKRVCKFICNNRGFEAPCRIIWPRSVSVEEIDNACKSLWATS